MLTIMLDDYLKTNPEVKDLPRPGIEPQPPSPQSDAIASQSVCFVAQSLNIQ